MSSSATKFKYSSFSFFLRKLKSKLELRNSPMYGSLFPSIKASSSFVDLLTSSSASATWSFVEKPRYIYWLPIWTWCSWNCCIVEVLTTILLLEDVCSYYCWDADDKDWEPRPTPPPSDFFWKIFMSSLMKSTILLLVRHCWLFRHGPCKDSMRKSSSWLPTQMQSALMILMKMPKCTAS